ncbi:MAG TPA: hypothetical protein VIL18_05130 [Longimicrobiales bacterium]
MSLLVALYLLLVIALPLALSLGVSCRTLPEGDACPLCRAETIRIRARYLDWASAVLPRIALQRRWCLTCGWEGVCKVKATEPAVTEAPPTPVDARPAPPPVRQHGEAVELRKLEVDGCAWRVFVECWYEAGRWHGRLLFAAPSGQLWPDPARTFTGLSRQDVLDQVLALPDRLLACRLREAISD